MSHFFFAIVLSLYKYVNFDLYLFIFYINMCHLLKHQLITELFAVICLILPSESNPKSNVGVIFNTRYPTVDALIVLYF
jgi:hypothetical protein